MLALVSLVFALAATSLADNRGRSQKIVCMDNLRQIGEGFDAWRFEHQDSHPWHVLTNDGGSKGLGVGLPWIEFSFLSNTVASPRILACPSDLKILPKTAENWGNGPGGFQNSGYRNNSVSYTIGLHSYAYAPLQFLSSDRNLKVDLVNVTCGPASILSAAAGISFSNPNNGAAWTNEVHGLLGNVLVSDGSVNEMSSPLLKSFFRNWQEDSGTLHLLIP